MFEIEARVMDLISTISVILSIITVFANILVALVIASKKWGGMTIYCMAKFSLALSDIVYAVFACVSVLIDGEETSGVRWSMMVQNAMKLISYTNISLIAAQRYSAIKHPFKYSSITKRKQLLYILSVWLVGFFFSSIDIIFAVFPTLPIAFYLKDAFILIVGILMFSLTVISTAVMLQTYYKHTRSKVLHSGSSVTSNRKNHASVVKMTCLITLGYVLLCVPWLILDFYIQVKNKTSVPKDFAVNITLYEDTSSDDLDEFELDERIYDILHILFNLNGILDVIVYNVLDGEFRSSLNALLSCKLF